MLICSLERQGNLYFWLRNARMFLEKRKKSIFLVHRCRYPCWKKERNLCLMHRCRFTCLKETEIHVPGSEIQICLLEREKYSWLTDADMLIWKRQKSIFLAKRFKYSYMKKMEIYISGWKMQICLFERDRNLYFWLRKPNAEKVRKKANDKECQQTVVLV